MIINFGTNDINAAHPDWTVDDYLFYTRCVATNVQQRYGSAVILSTPHKWSRGVHLKHHWQPLLVDRLRDFCRKSGLSLADVYMQYGIDEDSKIPPPTTATSTSPMHTSPPSRASRKRQPANPR